MGVDDQEKGVAVHEKQQMGDVKEEDTLEIQRQIVDEAFRILQYPESVTLTYPNADTFYVARGEEDPDYEHGSQIRFVMLEAHEAEGRGQICVAIVDNKSDENSVTLGAGFLQTAQGKRSRREIGVTRFVQTIHEQSQGGGTYSRIVASDTIKDALGTYSLRARAFPKRVRSDSPTFGERWDEGSAQLANTMIYDVLGKGGYFEGGDYKDLLSAMRRGKPNSELTKKVVEKEHKLKLAVTASEPKAQ